MAKYDWVIAALPKVHPRSPLPGPARLKAVLQKAGYSCLVKDFNNDLYHRITQERGLEFWSGADFSFNDPKAFEQLYNEALAPIFRQWASELLALKPRFIGLSLLSKFSRNAAFALLREIRRQNPKQTLVIGGPGALYCAKDFKERDVIDHYILGDGEFAILELTRGNLKFPGVNSEGRQLTNEELDQQPYNDYSDLMANLYPSDLEGGLNPVDFDRMVIKPAMTALSTLYIEGSRGCIRRCGFCSVVTHTERFRWRNGRILAEEILHYNQTYGSTRFEFSDNLVNGNVQCLTDLCERLIEFKKQGLGSFAIEGNFLCRNSKSFGDKHYDLMKEAGFYAVSMGVESTSEKVREHMAKGFTDEDMRFSIRQLRARQIEICLLFVIGYPTETDADHQMNLQFLDWLKDVEGTQGFTIGAGSTMLLASTLPIWKQVDELGIINKDSITHWSLGDNTRAVRLKRYLEFVRKARALGFNVNDRFYHAYENEYESYRAPEIYRPAYLPT